MKSMEQVRGSAALVTAALVLAACSKQVEEVSAVAGSPVCRPSDADPQTLSRVGDIRGEYRLFLSVPEGEKAGASTTGTLKLIPRDSTGVPLYGWTDIDLSAVGAHQQGALDSSSMEAPGVLVLTTRFPDDPGRIRRVTIRLGSHANRSGTVAFDGAYTALYVRWIEKGGFGGDWASGIQRPDTTGEFCAVRVSPSD
jgi:hypothetical protein